MASGQIRMTPDTMRERAGEYRTEADNVQSVIDKMDRLLETLLTEWEGSASEAYANKFAELRPLFVKVYQNIGSRRRDRGFDGPALNDDEE